MGNDTFPANEVINCIANSISKVLLAGPVGKSRAERAKLAREKARELGRISRDYEFGKIYRLDFPDCDEQEVQIRKLKTLMAFFGDGWDTLGLEPCVHGFAVAVARDRSRQSLSRMNHLMTDLLLGGLDRGVAMGMEPAMQAAVDANYERFPLETVYPGDELTQRTRKMPLVMLLFDFPDNEETRKIAEFFRSTYEMTIFY